jgi:CheY-like chemotaxis protein
MIALKRILLVEDKLPDVELTLAALQECHLANEVVVVRDGVEALDYLFYKGKFADRPTGLPAVILLDNKMPRMNGLDVLREIKADPDLQMIPVVMLTSSQEEPDLIESYKLGVSSYVVKPVDFQQFVVAVKQIGVFWAILNETPSCQPTNMV